MIDRIRQIGDEATAAAESAATAAELEQVRVDWLGRKAELPNLLRGVRDLPAEQRGEAGKAANEVRVMLEGLIDSRLKAFEAAEVEHAGGVFGGEMRFGEFGEIGLRAI